ncbi:acyltransferase family protein [Barrientosiimonas marina]|uniref:Acyltransferase n=1 Tax=Lentibacillus kimchii TaxID=1542911 RepID=A0ABW2UWT8_9BACI
MERNNMIDYVKGFAILFVVAIHTKAVQGAHLGIIDGDDANFIINTLARFAVPFFFAASGYLFVQKLNTIQRDNKNAEQVQYAKKYIRKLIKLYLAWFIFYFLFELAVNFIETEKNSAALWNMFTNYIDHFSLWSFIYLGDGWPVYHLWFLPALIWAILILFLFIQMRLIRVLFVVSIGLHLIGLFGQSYSFLFDIPFNTRDGIFFALFYVTLGGMMAKYPVFASFARKMPTRSAVIWLGILSCVQILEGFITLQVYDGKAENYFISTIPLVIVLFLLVIKHNQMGKGSVMAKIGAKAVGIYVSHVFIMASIHILMHRMGLTMVEDWLLWKVIITPIVLLLAFIFYNLLQNGKKLAS